MFARTRAVGLALCVALTIPRLGDAAIPSPRRGFAPPPRSRLQEVLARRGITKPDRPRTPTAARRLSVSSEFSACGAWSMMNEGGAPFFRYSHAMVYDSARDRMLIIGGRDNYGNPAPGVWSLTIGASSSLTEVQTVGLGTNVPIVDETAIYDPVRDRVVVCGGISEECCSSTLSVFELTLSGTPTWNEITPAGDAPPWRDYHSAIYDASRDRMVIFGGEIETGSDNSVWTLNFSGTPAWTHMTPTGTPPKREGHTAIYDGPRDRMVVFGGTDSAGTFHNDTWTLSLAGAGAWTQAATSGGPPAARCFHNAVADVPRSRMLLFSGEDSQTNQLSDVWRLSLTSPMKWTLVTPTGTVDTPLLNLASVYDPVRQTMVSAFGDESWELGNLAGTPAWTELNPPGQPPLSRDGATAIYDAPRQRLVMFGGMIYGTYQPSRDVWALSTTDSTWSRIITAGTPPPYLQYASAIFDPIGNRMIVFGGAGKDVFPYPDLSARHDVWSLSLSGTPSWTHLNPGGSDPPDRFAHTAILDAPRNRMIVYGGDDNVGGTLSDVWALALSGGTTWSHLSPTGGPAPAKEYHTAVFDAPRNRMLAYGWDDDVVWALGLAGTPSWSTVAAAGTAPPVLVAHQAAYDAVRDRMLVSEYETWALTLSGTPTWGKVGAPEPMLAGGPGSSSAYDTSHDRWLILTSYSEIYALSFPAMYMLNLAASPIDGGAVDATPYGECQVAGTQVQLAATPADGYGFTGWSGDASGTTNPLTVMMNGNKSITAQFATYTLTTMVSPPGGGTVGRNPALPTYPAGSQVTLTAAPQTGYAFENWSGDASGSSNPLTVTMDQAKSITANFSGFPVTVTVTPTGGGTVTRNPDQPGYPPGSQVTLTASTSPYLFLGWSGDATGTDNPLTLTVDSAKNITAHFGAYTVTVSASPPNCGGVTRSPDQAVYASGTNVTLTATPVDPYAFTGWSGDTTGTTNPLALTVYANRNIVANFAIPTPSCGAWTPIASDTVPSQRHGTAAAWDPVRHRIVMCGGWGYAPYLYDDYQCLSQTWALTPAGGWTPITPTGNAPPYVGANMVYDPDGDRFLVMNGWNRAYFGMPHGNGSVEALTFSGSPAWSDLSATGYPPAKMGSSAVYDPVRHRVICFAGQDVSYPGYPHNEVWALSLTGTPAWSLLATSGTPPDIRRSHAAIYDPVRDRMLVFGGMGTSIFNPFNDLWALSLSGTPTWSKLSPWQEPPSPRFDAGAIYDPLRDRMLLVGGANANTNFDETWSLSLKTVPTWRKLAAGGVALGPRSSFSAVYDPDDDLVAAIDGLGAATADGYRKDSKRLDCAGGWWLDSGADYGGTVTANPVKNCYTDGEVVNVIATGWNNNPLLEWLGDLSGSDPVMDLTMNGNKAIFAHFPEAPVAVEAPVPPAEFALEAIRPNPNPGPVAMSYALPHEAPVRLRVFDVAGRVIADLVDGVQPAGRHVATWTTRTGLRPGIYLAHFETPAGVWTRRFVLIP